MKKVLPLKFHETYLELEIQLNNYIISIELIRNLTSLYSVKLIFIKFIKLDCNRIL